MKEAGEELATGQSGGAASGTLASGTAGPEDHLAEHPVTVAMSPGQARAYVERARAGVAIAQSNERVAALQAFDTTERQYRDTGNAANPPSQAQLVGALGLQEGRQRYAQLEEAGREGASYTTLRALPSAALHDMLGQEREAQERESQVATAAGAAGGNASVPTTAVAPSAPTSAPTPSQRAIARILRERQQDPMQAALDTGGYGLKPLAFSQAAVDDGSLAASLRARALAGRQIAGEYQTEPALLSRAEVRAMAATLRGATPAQQQAVLKALVEGPGDDAMTTSSLEALSQEEPVLALAGWQMGNAERESGGQEVADGAAARGWSKAPATSVPAMMLEGRHLMQPDADKSGKAAMPMPPDRVMWPIFAGLDKDASGGMQAMCFEGAKACYASLAAHEGDHSGKFDPERMAEAVFYAKTGSSSPETFASYALSQNSQGPQSRGQAPKTAIDNSTQGTPSASYGTTEALQAPGVLSDLANINPVIDKHTLEASGIDPTQYPKFGDVIGRKDDDRDARSKLEEETGNLLTWTKWLDGNPDSRKQLLALHSLTTDADRAQLGNLRGYLDATVGLSKDDPLDAEESREFFKELRSANAAVRAHLIANLSPEEVEKFKERVTIARDGKVSPEEVQKLLLENARHAAKLATEGGSLTMMARLAGGHPATPLDPLYPVFRKRISDLRSKVRKWAKNGGNVAVADVSIQGIPPTVAASSRIESPSPKEITEGFIGKGEEIFRNKVVTDSAGETYYRGNVDSEDKILNHLATRLGNNSQARGSVTIMTERQPCEGCSDVIGQFRKRYPRIRLTVIDNQGQIIFPIPRGQKNEKQ
jgi:hypothetical protein